MIVTLQPHLKESNHHQARLQNPSFILHEKTLQYHWQGRSPLSIKTFFSGRALYTLGNGYFFMAYFS
jgi:hypothetical protein